MSASMGLVSPVFLGELEWGVPWGEGASGVNPGNLRNLGGGVSVRELGQEKR